MAAVGAHLTRTRATLPQRRDGRNDLEATRTFYSDAMGFPLVKVEAAATLEQTLFNQL